jgi:HSP20 family protein
MDSRTFWEPSQDIRRLQRELEQIFARVPAARWPLTGEYPPINVTRSDTSIVVEALCPGMDRGALDVTVVGETVSIRGERKPPPDVSDARSHRRERPFGTFTRTVGIGELLDAERTQATYTDGILRIQLTRAPDAAPKRIAIQS